MDRPSHQGGNEISRDSSKFRLAQLSEEQKAVERGSNMGHHDQRETMLRKSKRPNGIQVPDKEANQQEEPRTMTTGQKHGRKQMKRSRTTGC